MKIYITGVSGFIGSEAAKRFIAEGYEVIGLLRHSVRENQAIRDLQGNVEFVYGDLQDYDSLERTLEQTKPDIIYHLGALSPVNYSFDRPIEVSNVNYMGTVRLAEAARRVLPNLKKFIFASTMEVYGADQKKRPFTEDLEPHPNCPYAVAKLASEKYLQYLHHAFGFPAIIFRQTNVYGRKENNFFVIEAIISRMLKNPKIIEMGSFEPVRNFIHIDDLIDLDMAVIQNHSPKLLGEVFNTGPDNGVTIGDLAVGIADIMGWKGKIKWNAVEVRPGKGEVWYLNSSNAKVTELLGWEPETTLQEGLKKTINYWKNHEKET